jgi:transcription initiation factor TFIID subunit 12
MHEKVGAQWRLIAFPLTRTRVRGTMMIRQFMDSRQPPHECPHCWRVFVNEHSRHRSIVAPIIPLLKDPASPSLTLIRFTQHCRSVRSNSFKMSSSAPTGQPQGVQQPAPPQVNRPPPFRPDQMRALPDQFTADEKKKWEAGLMQLYQQMDRSPPDSQEHREARKKIWAFSDTLRSKIQAKQKSAQGPSQAPPQGAQSQNPAAGAAAAPAPGQQSNPLSSQHKQMSQNILNHVNKFQYVVPSEYAPGSPDANKWIQEHKTRFSKALMAMENCSAQIKALDDMVKVRAEQGKALTETEQNEVAAKKEQFRKNYMDAKRWVDGFQKQQSDALRAAGGGIAGGLQSAPHLAQQAAAAQKNTETVNAAMQAAQGQAMQAGRSNVVGVNGQTADSNDQTSQAQAAQLPGPTALPPNSHMPGTQPPNIKIEVGAQQQVNTAIPVAMQQQVLRQQTNSPHSAIPQSATSFGPPAPLTHKAALAQVGRTYSTAQTTGTPNVIGAASHAHPSIPREASNINTNKMPIPKVLPPNAIAPPQPVPMPAARPTISGGPANVGSGLMGQPVLQKTPGFNLEGEGERVMNKRKLDELVRQVTGGGEGLDSGEGLTPEVEDVRFRSIALPIYSTPFQSSDLSYTMLI